MTLVWDGVTDGQKVEEVAQIFGTKAAGFTVIPPAWRPHALFIGANLYELYLVGGPLFPHGVNDIWRELRTFEDYLGRQLIIRSSATDESITERGQFKSIKITLDSSCDVFRGVITDIFSHYKLIGTKAMCLIVQSYVNGVEIGFLSNELRLVDKPYRWVVERHLSPAADHVPTIPLSAKQARENSANEPLVCLSRQEMLSRLRSVARFFWKSCSAQRVLLEWCWDGSKLWIVQRDNDNPGTAGRNPEKLISSYFKPPTSEAGTIFQRYSVGSSTPWQKLRNVTDFATRGTLPPHRLFHAVARNVASALQTAEGASALADEIDKLTGGHAVLRTDAVRKGYNLPRTHTVDGASAVSWLREQLAFWVNQSVGPDDIAFIMHSYISANAAAWSYYKRGSPIVRIDALWGLADGMQYYPTDTFICRADNGLKISETIRYKELVLLEQPDGRWITDHIAPRYARHRVLSRLEQADIAVRTKEISDNIETDVQIMWFVGVPKDFFLEHNLPWFKVTPEQSVDERRSKLLASIKIRSFNDLEQLEKVIPGSKKVILEPSGEDLRSNEFIRAVGTLCVRQNLPVEIRGSILSHAFHQLAKDGVQVYSAEPGKRPVEMRQRKAFDKLVRDQVPENIEAKGETVSVDELAPEDLAMALIGKLFEEAEEFLAADTNNDRLEELADLFEIIRALADVSKIASFSEVVGRADSKRGRRGGFDKGVILRSTSVIAHAPEMPRLFEKGAGRRRINLSALRESQSGMRSQTPIITLLSQGPRVLSLEAPGTPLTVRLKIDVVAGAVSVEILEINDNQNGGQQRMI